jgi:hypothetical protein
MWRQQAANPWGSTERIGTSAPAEAWSSWQQRDSPAAIPGRWSIWALDAIADSRLVRGGVWVPGGPPRLQSGWDGFVPVRRVRFPSTSASRLPRRHRLRVRSGCLACVALNLVAGGHSVDDAETRYGMDVTGIADARRLLRNDAGSPRKADQRSYMKFRVCSAEISAASSAGNPMNSSRRRRPSSIACCRR